MQRSIQHARRVLVVDDDLDTAETIAFLLRDMGHKVEFAISARAALDVVRRVRPELVFLDLGLPDMDGHELGKLLKQDPSVSGVRIMVITGHRLEEARRRTFECGFDAHLVKPVDPVSLEALIGRLPRLSQ